MPSKTTSTFAAFHGIVVCVLWCGGFAWFSVGFQFFFPNASELPGEYVKRLRRLKDEAPELLIPHAYTRWEMRCGSHRHGANLRLTFDTA